MRTGFRHMQQLTSVRENPLTKLQANLERGLRFAMLVVPDRIRCGHLSGLGPFLARLPSSSTT